jgi:hypothetical protein
VAISPESVRTKTVLQDVLSYKNDDVLDRLRKELHLDENSAKALFDDLKKFLWLAAVTPPSIVPSPIIDEAWHRFVLYTMDYSEFCSRYFGGFLHHAPQRVGEVRLSVEDLIPTIDAMHAEFGGVPSDNWHYAEGLPQAA